MMGGAIEGWVAACEWARERALCHSASEGTQTRFGKSHASSSPTGASGEGGDEVAMGLPKYRYLAGASGSPQAVFADAVDQTWAALAIDSFGRHERRRGHSTCPFEALLLIPCACAFASLDGPRAVCQGSAPDAGLFCRRNPIAMPSPGGPSPVRTGCRWAAGCYNPGAVIGRLSHC